MNQPDWVITICIVMAIGAGIIWLLTFGMVWWLISVGLFISCLVLLFSGAVGPALGCLILCPIAFGIGSLILEAKDRESARKQRLAEIPKQNPSDFAIRNVKNPRRRARRRREGALNFRAHFVLCSPR